MSLITHQKIVFENEIKTILQNSKQNYFQVNQRTK
jgi:hypothetical protein